MNKDPFTEAFVLLLWLMLVDALIFANLLNAHLLLADLARERASFPNAEKSFDFWALLNPIGITIVGLAYIALKSLCGYYPAIQAYFYVYKISATNFTPHKIIIPLTAMFFISASLYLGFASFQMDNAFSKAFTYESPLGSPWYIALFASLAAPFIVKIILTQLARRKQKASQTKE